MTRLYNLYINGNIQDFKKYAKNLLDFNADMSRFLYRHLPKSKAVVIYKNMLELLKESE